MKKNTRFPFYLPFVVLNKLHTDFNVSKMKHKTGITKAVYTKTIKHMLTKNRVFTL